MKNNYLQSFCIGIIAGMRSISAPALVSNYLADKQSVEIDKSSFRFLASQNTANVLTLLAIGEMIADKLPIVPDRISPVPLIGRGISGGICGAALCIAEDERPEIGALAGLTGAIISTYGFYYLRGKLSENTGIPNLLLGLAEDALAVKGGQSVLEGIK
jgi:uncharacterized membrane protein